MSSLFLSILLSFLSTSQNVKPDVEVKFDFDHSGLGKPTLAMYYYDVSIKNKSESTVYFGIPRWFGQELNRSSKINGAQYDTFGKTTGSTLFCESTFTIFAIQPNQKIYIEDFRIETFDEKLQNEATTLLGCVIFSRISVGEYSLEEFMGKKELHGNNLEYLLTLAYTEDVSVKLAK